MKIIKSSDRRKKYPDRIELRGMSNSGLVKALSHFPKDVKITFEREEKYSHKKYRAFTLTYNRNLNGVTIKQFY